MKTQTRYRTVAKRSFKAKWTLFVFEHVLSTELVLTLETFNRFQLSDESIALYANQFWQYLGSEKIHSKTVDEVYAGIKEFEKQYAVVKLQCERDYVDNVFPELYPLNAFETLIRKETCHYCGISVADILALGEADKLRKKSLRGWTLEIDRLKPNNEYTLDNCVMSCYWCNNAKTDEFSAAEFKPIGQAIGNALRERLAKH